MLSLAERHPVKEQLEGNHTEQVKNWSNRSKNLRDRPKRTGGGLLKYNLGRDVPLRLEKLAHFDTKFYRKMRPIFIPEPQILSKIYQKFRIIVKNC